MNGQRKLAIALVLLVALSLVLTACGGPKPAAGPKKMSAEDIAKKILELTSFKQWEALWPYLHPDAQAMFKGKDEYVASRKNAPEVTIEKFEVKEAISVAEWTDKGGTEKTYKDVAEVPISIEASVPVVGKQTMKQTMHLAKAKDGTWRFFTNKP